MPRAQNISAENNFIGGLKTEFTGLNFPENACTETFNCIFDKPGNVTRRKGFEYEDNATSVGADRHNSAMSTFLWNNADGSGLVNLLVVQIGPFLHFYKTTSATLTNGLSWHHLPLPAFSLYSFRATGSPVPDQIEAQFATGDGRLFVFHPCCDPFYITYDANTNALAAFGITIKIRDFEGVEDGLALDQTQVALTDLHNYNLTNQGWYTGTVYLAQFFAAMGFYPSNTEVWWYYKGPDVDDAGREKFLPAHFRPLSTHGKSPAPKGGHILDAFNQDRSTVSGVPNIPTVTSGGNRPSTGAFHAGRVFYAGLTKATFNDKIYFSKIIESTSDFGKAYQVNDPTSENADLLPSDGGVIAIQDCNIIHKLVSVQNGLLVFASNGIWFITGSQGIGFAANDYTVTKISSIQSLTHTSFVSVHGYPVWWNEEGIYAITPSEGGSLTPKSLTDATIARFYADIPLNSKRYARGDYNPLTTTIQWVYRSTATSDVTQRYEFDRLLNLNTSTQAFYPWTLPEESLPHIHDIKFIPSPGGVNDPPPVFKYLTTTHSTLTYFMSFSEEHQETYRDWPSIQTTGEYESYFITGYKVHGQAQRKFQSNYVVVFSDNEEDTAYQIQGIWNFANSADSGKFSSVQTVYVAQDDYRHAFRKHKIRGHGLAMQFKVSSLPMEPFNIMGWSAWETSNQRI